MPSKKNYNRPAQITDFDRQEAMKRRKRDMEDMSYEDNIPMSDKEDMKRMIDVESYRDEAYAKGGMVKKKKYAMGGSVRGGGIAIKGVGKGKVC
jgi:hypothetical protein